MKNQNGQTILILILIMVVALAIGLSIVQKSLVDVSTASKVEQSSRAFSAAEAGIEKALSTNSNASCTECQNFADNLSTIKQVQDSNQKPGIPLSSGIQEALGYPPLAKEDVAQVWLADPNATLPTCASPYVCYTQTSLDVYWGNSNTDKAAIELTLVFYDGSIYKSNKWYLDNPSASRNPSNGFDNTSSCTGHVVGVNTYQCKKTLDFSSIRAVNPSAAWMLLRARLLYNETSQPFAVQATGQGSACSVAGGGCYLPPQARSITSTGVSGETQRKVNVFLENKVVPSYFDYVIFSAGDIKK